MKNINYFMTILMVAVTTFFVSCANPTTNIPSMPVTPVTPEPPRPIQHFDEKVLAEYSCGEYTNCEFTSSYFNDTGDVPREIQVTYSAKDIGLLISINHWANDLETKYENGTWVNTYGVYQMYNSITYESTDLEDKVASYLPTQDEWNMMKEKGLCVGASDSVFVKKIVIKEI